MKKIALIIVFGLVSLVSVAQEKTSRTDSLLREIAYLQTELLKSVDNHAQPRYKMYQTENIYNLLKLDTATGVIEQVQWSLDEDNEGSVYVNYEYLSDNRENGTFELYPTKNMYQFILLNKVNGRTWHVQWGMDSNKRWIKRIY